MSAGTLAEFGILAAYFLCLGALAAFGAHRWYLVGLYLHLRNRPPRPRARFQEPPLLTVQLPLYNEVHVARRLIEAVAALEYPRSRLEIQVLDDSTDETTAIVAEAVADLRRRGFDAHHLHRRNRDGWKAGALAAGLGSARGELVAIFDADFLPGRDFAARIVDYFTDPRVGMVQMRWGHLNAGYSALTRIQSYFLDGHFVIEQTARNRSGRFFNFNGTAGIWRRACIEDSGGWQPDTLTEDLDLSYRAQLRGWKFVFLNECETPAELPVEIASFKLQQHRWAKGSIQTARKLLPGILRSRLPFPVKLESTVHLTANVAYLLTLLLTVLVVPAVWLRRDLAPWTLAVVDLPLFVLATLQIVAFYAVAHREARGRTGRFLRWLPFLMAVGIGLSLNNARAVIEGLCGRRSPFRRTPKFNLRPGEPLIRHRYRTPIHPDTWIELALAIYFTAATLLAAAAGLWGAVPFLLLFLTGYAYTAMVAIRQSLTSGNPAIS